MARKKRNRKGIKRYPTDFSQKCWEIIKDLLRTPLWEAVSPHINMRKLLNAILYVTRGGIAWRLLPLEFRHGSRCTAISAAGRKAASGSVSMMRGAHIRLRRLSKDYEVLTKNSEAFVYIAMNKLDVGAACSIDF